MIRASCGAEAGMAKAKKSVSKKPVGASAKKAAKKTAKKPAKKAAKKPAKKPSKKLAKKAAKKPSVKRGQKAAGKTLRKAAKGSPAAPSRAAALASRKPLATAARKTARSRLIQRAAAHDHAPNARKMALRTPVSGAKTLKAGSLVPAPRSDSFDPKALELRRAVAQDHPAIRKTLDAVFGRPVESRLVAALRDSSHAQVEMLAVYDGALAGHVMFSRVIAEIGGRTVPASALAPLAVSPKFAGFGIATRLVAAALLEARAVGSAAVFVLGKPGFYQRFGFSSQLAGRFASPWPGKQFMALEFEPGALAGENGDVVYPAAFAPFL